MGQTLRVFRCETEKAYLVYRKKKGRLDLCSSLDFFEKEKDSLILIDELDISNMQAAKPVPMMQAFLEVCDEVLNVRHSLPCPAINTNSFWKVSVFVLGFYFFLAGTLYWFSNSEQTAKEKPLEPQIVKIIKKAPTIVQPKQVTMTFNQNELSVQKKILKRSLKKNGGLIRIGQFIQKRQPSKRRFKLRSFKSFCRSGF